LYRGEIDHTFRANMNLLPSGASVCPQYFRKRSYLPAADANVVEIAYGVDKLVDALQTITGKSGETHLAFCVLA